MLSFPTSTVFERRIPKQKFYQNLDVTAEVKRLFILGSTFWHLTKRPLERLNPYLEIQPFLALPSR